jgi:hypothetical protein
VAAVPSGLSVTPLRIIMKKCREERDCALNGVSRRTKTFTFTFRLVNATWYINTISVFVRALSRLDPSPLGFNALNCIVEFLYMPWSRIIEI